MPRSFGDSFENGDTLRADGQAVGGVFDVAAGVDLALNVFQGGADFEFRKGRVRVLAGMQGGGDEWICHGVRSSLRYAGRVASPLLTRSDVERLTLDGTFDGQRYELIEGQLIRKSGQIPPHAWTLRHVYHWLGNVFGLVRLRCRAPIEVASEDQEHNEPHATLVATNHCCLPR